MKTCKRPPQASKPDRVRLGVFHAHVQSARTKMSRDKTVDMVYLSLQPDIQNLDASIL